MPNYHKPSKSKKNTKQYTKKTKKHSSKSKKNYRKKNKKIYSKRQGGGFNNNCNLASVKEPGFNISSLGDIAGLSIPESRGAIFRPNCKPDTYQAMTP
jgi:hypothetical protein